ncbi:uncharacterized protein LOC133928449 [Phragmites australis]|uniref:uncharacterized protein LOC133928449 n=1 Tax=Phragmites australis TaxID=29695 RepID=UPI002D770ECA|nr:uncharacterized protein LOC133928449 [Phragmites australis]
MRPTGQTPSGSSFARLLFGDTAPLPLANAKSNTSAQDKSNIDDGYQEPKYDPQCGMSKEEFEWRFSLQEKVRQHALETLHKIQIEAEKVRHHFNDDPDALKVWDEYMDGVRCAASHKFTSSLYSYAHNSGLYEQLMRRKARSKTFVGMLSGECDKLKRATRNKMPIFAVVAGVAAAFATGLAVGTGIWKHQQSKET